MFIKNQEEDKRDQDEIGVPEENQDTETPPKQEETTEEEKTEEEKIEE